MYSSEEIHTFLSSSSGLSVDLIINENKRYLFTVLEKKRRSVRISLHRMFLEAPLAVLEDLSLYLQTGKKSFLMSISQFIDEKSYQQPYLQRVEPQALHTTGDYYDLPAILRRLQEDFFEHKGPNLITWFGQKKTRSRIIFGEYQPLLQLVKINKKLDHPSVPDYFVDYVVFHEMLHHVIPSSTMPSGRRSIHGPEFRKREKSYIHFKKAVEWQNKHKHLFFEGVF